jgi:RimJ/RimL family protein N-acetyltransferase
MPLAIKRMTDYVFANFEIVKIYAMPFDFNIASQKVLQKAGFELEAVLKKAAIKNGKIVNLHYYSIIKNDN